MSKKVVTYFANCV
nr:unnamed protein product [Callosobruchus chinensis]